MAQTKASIKQAKDFSVGDRFVIKHSPYGGEQFTVTNVYADSIRCLDGRGKYDACFFFNCNFEFYGAAVQIISRESDSAQPTRTQIIGLSLTFGAKAFSKTIESLDSEHNRAFRAFAKAEREFAENKSIRFKNDVLTFVSRFSGKQRKVTKFGCHRLCDCKAETSYHTALYHICAEVYRSNVIPVEFGKFSQRQRLAA